MSNGTRPGILAVALVASPGLTSCWESETVKLGGQAPTVNAGGQAPDAAPAKAAAQPPAVTVVSAPQLLAELCAGGKAENPTLTENLLEIYFSSDRSGGPEGSYANIWRAWRTGDTGSFGAPTLVESLSTGNETSPAVSKDGRTLWFGSKRDEGQGELDIWVSGLDPDSHDWSEPTNYQVLNSSAKDIPRPPGRQELVMPMASQRDGDGYATYFAARPSVTASFAAPDPVPVITVPGRTISDGFLTDDGLMLLFNAELEEFQGDLYVAVRNAPDDPFTDPRPLGDLNTDGDERDPWLSKDENHLFFTSDRDGTLCIYEVIVRRNR